MPTPDNPLNPIWSNPQYDFTRASQIGTLPIRGEKRLVPVEIDMAVAGEEAVGSYEAISFAKNTFTDYISIRIPNRKDNTGNVFTYRFLINPKTVQITRQTMDSHTMARGGWQFGIWGEDTIDIHLSGITAGQYFEDGLTDKYGDFSISHRNLKELVNMFENNGYFFEGEEANDMWNAPDYTRKRIKAHSDVVLSVGNFLWHGMFNSMTITNNADMPYLSHFELTFLAWKERFKTTSPWIDAKHNNVIRGHEQNIVDPIKNPTVETKTSMSQEELDSLPQNSLLGEPPSDLFPKTVVNP